ncbi:MAG TPA: hypothetical protein VF652_10580 [Allosphingosinicella sp.]|jgi:hypothetical protein
MTINSLSALNEELGAASPLHIEVLTSDELNVVAGGDALAADGCTCGTRSICHIDGTDDSDGAYEY